MSRYLIVETRGVVDWKEVDMSKGILPTDKIKFEYPDTAPPSGLYAANMILMDTDGQGMFCAILFIFLLAHLGIHSFNVEIV